MGIKKHIFIFLAALALVLSFGICALAQTGTVTADLLNVRSSTTTTSDVLTKVSRGSEVEIVASDGVWYRILLPDGREGFVKTEYVTANPAVFGVVTASELFVRASTGTLSTALTTLPYGTVVELLAYDGYWYKISYRNGQKGYVSADYISLDLSLAVETPYAVYGYINATQLNIRALTDVNSQSLTKLPLGTCVEILASDGLWHKVKTASGIMGYASADYISFTPVEEPEDSDVTNPMESYTSSTAPSVTVPEATEPVSDEKFKFGQAIVEEAMKHLGKPYVWSAAGPSSFDCSGFTMYIMNLFNIKIPHQSGSQYNYGYSVKKENLVPGDLVFFSSKSKSGVAHVGIYAGEGNFIHASSGSAKSVTISSLSANYYTKHYLGARRLIQ
ncbi:MAG: SH3 domain-containing protein [Clostridia bacterium]|nr:SH3 domain-containing protein [Clostridia bacterium]